MKPYKGKYDLILETMTCFAVGAVLGGVMTYLGITVNQYLFH